MDTHRTHLRTLINELACPWSAGVEWSTLDFQGTEPCTWRIWPSDGQTPLEYFETESVETESVDALLAEVNR